MLSRSSSAVYSCQRQLSQSTKTLYGLRSNSTVASNPVAATSNPDTPKRRRATIPLAQDFGGLLIPDAHSRAPRLGRDANRTVTSQGPSPIASRLAGRSLGENPTHPESNDRQRGASAQTNTRRNQGSERNGWRTQSGSNSQRGENQATNSGNQRPRRSQRHREEEPELTVTPKAENFAIEIGTDLHTLFSSPKATVPSALPTSRSAPPPTQVTPTRTTPQDQPTETVKSPLPLPATMLPPSFKYAVQRQGGYYSLFDPTLARHIGSTSSDRVSAVDLAQRMIFRKAEVGRKSKMNALGVVTKLTSTPPPA